MPSTLKWIEQQSNEPSAKAILPEPRSVQKAMYTISFPPMKKPLLFSLMASALLGSAFAQTIATYNAAFGLSPNFLAADFTATPISIQNQYPYGPNYAPAFTARSVNNGYSGSDAIISFALGSPNPSGFVVTGFAFDQMGDLFNNVYGIPNLNLLIQEGTNSAEFLANVPYPIYTDNYSPKPYTFFNLSMDYTIKSGSVSFLIDMGQIGWLGSPSLHVQNIAVSGYALQPVPEPSTYSVFGLGTATLVYAYRRKAC